MIGSLTRPRSERARPSHDGAPAGRRRPRLWIDLASPSHPFFFRSLVDALAGIDSTVTVRQKTETVPLARDVGFDPRVVGRDFDNRLLRMAGIPLRTLQLTAQMPDCHVALASRNVMAILAAKARGVPSIHFTDNDITAHRSGLHVEELYNRFEAMATHNVVPAAFETSELTRLGADRASVHTYDGTKEDVYVASFDPDQTFTERLPFDDYVVIRPESLSAAYVDAERSLVPDLLSGFVDRDTNVVYLPRNRGDEAYAEPYSDAEVFVPDEPPNGLQLAWHARCVLTGSGTMAREAAAMDKPAVSFFPNRLLSVDDRLVEEGRLRHSRDPDEIVEYVDSVSGADREPALDRCKRVRAEVATVTASIINDEC
jgi:predicted glycosyltransferase